MYYYFKLSFAQILSYLLVAFVLGMDPDHRESSAYVVIYILTEIQFLFCGQFIILERGVNRNFKRIQTTVAGYCDAAVYLAFNLEVIVMINYVSLNLKLRRKYLFVFECFKELFSDRPLKMIAAFLEDFKGYLKGLQS